MRTKLENNLKKEREDKFKKAFIIFIFVIFPLLGIFQESVLYLYPKYTIGEVGLASMDGKGQRSFPYTYVVEGKKKKSATNGFDGKIKQHHRYIVKYSYKFPIFSFIYYDRAVPDTVAIPPDGWSKIEFDSIFFKKDWMQTDTKYLYYDYSFELKNRKD